MMEQEIVQEIRDALQGAELWGELAGEFRRDFPALTYHHLGIECDFSFTGLQALLHKLVKDLNG